MTRPDRFTALFWSLTPVVLAALIATAGPGCSAPRSAAPGSAAALAAETSVKPGINADFTSPSAQLDRWIKSFEGESREIFAHRADILKSVGLRPGQHVADVGAGTGLFTALFAREVGPKGRVFAVDIAPVFLNHIRNRAAESGLSNVVTVLATPKSSGLPAASVDVVFICDTYHHFEFPRNTLASIHDALRRRGEIVLIDFKRVPGVSTDWVLNHVRAGQEVFAAEIREAGFEQVTEYPVLKDNYMVRFRKR